MSLCHYILHRRLTPCHWMLYLTHVSWVEDSKVGTRLVRSELAHSRSLFVSLIQSILFRFLIFVVVSNAPHPSSVARNLFAEATCKCKPVHRFHPKPLDLGG
ncbi:hypothetical protein BDV97DRAFT_6914 [Delphinella strobiligena]|nr:hypothetical protein BDV97DRAFT_6914 [Delphinella strobiligena]